MLQRLARQPDEEPPETNRADDERVEQPYGSGMERREPHREPRRMRPPYEPNVSLAGPTDIGDKARGRSDQGKASHRPQDANLAEASDRPKEQRSDDQPHNGELVSSLAQSSAIHYRSIGLCRLPNPPPRPSRPGQ
jgi:hypothetical protein